MAERKPNYVFVAKIISPLLAGRESSTYGVYVFYNEKGEKIVVPRSDEKRVKEYEEKKEYKKIKYIFPIDANGNLDLVTAFAKKFYIIAKLYDLDFSIDNFEILKIEFNGKIGIRDFFERGVPLYHECIEPNSEILYYVWYDGVIEDLEPKETTLGRWRKFGFGRVLVTVKRLNAVARK